MSTRCPPRNAPSVTSEVYRLKHCRRHTGAMRGVRRGVADPREPLHAFAVYCPLAAAACSHLAVTVTANAQ
eukprot:scaffold63452_cov65-Phaeocystis_antarctica.AAC.4